MKKVIGSLSLLLLMSCFVFAGDETSNSYRHYSVMGGASAEVEPNDKEIQHFPTTVAPSFPEEDVVAEEETSSDLQNALSKEVPVIEEKEVKEVLKEEVENAVDKEQENFKLALEKLMKQNLFEFDSDKILEDNHANLDMIAEFLKEYEKITIKVEGHTDNVGNEEYNKSLSERRANSVKNYLVEKGVDSSRITTEGFGATRPVADNDTEEGQAQNRRTEVIFQINY